MDKRICIIIVNYNNSRLSIDCYKSILQQNKSVDFTFVVVDNNSTEKEKNILKEFKTKDSHFDVVFLKDNIGYFPAMAKGQEYAYVKSDYDYMIIANNDLIFPADFMAKLCGLSEREDVMVISPDIVTKEGLHQNPHFINRISRTRKILYNLYYSNWYVSLLFLHLQRLFNMRRHEKDKPGFDKEQYIYIGFGACFILTKSFMDKIRLVDTRSFLMGEEQLLTQQVENAGGKIKYIPRIMVNHLDSATFKKMPTRFAFENEKKAYKLYKDNL